MLERRNRDLWSVFLVSAGTLSFEVVLTRIFALAYWHHFATLLIALALTGFGAAGSLTALLAPRLESNRPAALAGTALAAAAAMLFGYLAALAVGLEPLALAFSGRAWLKLALVTAILVVPFVLAAAHIALVLAWAASPGAAYAANLAGSGLGCLAAAVSLAWLLPNQALYPAAGLALLAAASQTMGCGRGWKSALVGLTGVLIVLAAAVPLPLHYAPFKDRSAALAARGSRLEQRATGLRGVVEIIGGPAFHYAPGLSLGCPSPLPAQRGLFVDGDLIGPVTRLEADRPPPGFVECLLISLPVKVFKPETVLVVRPGGGQNLLAALTGRPRRTAAVEDNPQIRALMRGPLAEFSGRLYRRSGLEIIAADPSLFLARSRERFDLILVGQGVRWGAGSVSGLGVSRLLTDQGLASMLDRLTGNGVLALTGPLMAPPRASIKLLATAAEALKDLGRDPADALALIRDWNTILLLVKPDGFSAAERRNLKRAAWKRGFDLSYLKGLAPAELNRFHLLPGEPLAEAARLILTGRQAELFETALFDLRPASRDRPYFFHFFRWRTLELISGGRGERRLAVTEWGLAFVWGGLGASLILAGLGVFPPLIRLGGRPRGLAYFALIGLGYMAAEITLLAETIYRLGRPAVSVPLVVGVFLAVSGLGSRLWGGRRPGVFALASAAALPPALLGVRFLPGGETAAALALAPAALFMGAPFAGGLSHLIGPDPSARTWAFGVNGFFSVAGSLIATLICLQVGHTAAMLLAVGCYLAAGLVFAGGKE